MAHVEKFNWAVAVDMIVVASCQDWEKYYSYCFSVRFISVFLFGRVVASHLIWDFLVLNRNCFAQCERWLFLSRCKLLRYFHVKQTKNSIFSFLCKLYFSSPCFCFAFQSVSQEYWECKTRKGFLSCSLCFRFGKERHSECIVSQSLSPCEYGVEFGSWFLQLH